MRARVSVKAALQTGDRELRVPDVRSNLEQGQEVLHVLRLVQLPHRAAHRAGAVSADNRVRQEMELSFHLGIRERIARVAARKIDALG